MHAAVVKPLDWFTIQLARLSVRDVATPAGQVAAAETLLRRTEFLKLDVPAPGDWKFAAHRVFRFTSPVVSPWTRNNIVHGRFFPVAEPWTAQPTVVLVHGLRLDRVIAELDFCRPLRRSLRGGRLPLDPLNLVTHRPQMAAENILLAASRHDLFSPLAEIEELARTWHEPTLWRLPHGHISLMLSLPVMERVVGWIRERT
jgi:hypothetical protein